MKNQDNHKPLSIEEMIVLLDNSSSTANDLDDFEKDAIDGFSEYTPSDKIEPLIHEVNLKISEKIAQSKNQRKTQKLVWASAAATIAFIVFVSVYFFNQNNTNLNLALNEKSNAYNLPLSTKNKRNLNIITNTTTLTNESKSIEKKASLSVAHSEKSHQIDNFKIKQEQVLNNIKEPKEVKHLSDDYKGVLASDEVDQITNNSLEQEKNTQQLDIALHTAKPSMANYESNDFKNNDKLEKKTINKKALDVQSSIFSAPEISVNESSSVKDIYNDSIIDKAYFKGGESAIRDYILDYFKNHSILKSARGHYFISGNVDEFGKFKVLNLIQISKDYCGCLEEIKLALNSMKTWNPAVLRNKKIVSYIEFNLIF